MKDVYTLADLRDRETLDAGADAPARLAVLGYPVTHSLSPQLHQPALDSAQMDLRYIRIEVEPGSLQEVVDAMRALNFVGANVTVPHKFEALACCTELDENARAIGAVNTLVFDGDETLGFNTDGPGFVRAIREDFLVDIKDLRILIIGAGGGAGQAIATQCAIEGCERLVLSNRTIAKADALAQRLAPYFSTDRLEGPGDRLEVIDLATADLSEVCDHIDLIINTTSVGLKRTDPSPFPASKLQPHHLVYDTIYNPARTRLLTDATAHGARVANGLSLLLHQGALAFERWFPGKQPLETMRQALRDTQG
jgi:shikimate dehydrogenase